MRVFIGAAAVAAALVSTSCGSSVTDPSKNVTDTFNGTITPAKLNGTGVGQFHSFNVSSGGEYTVKVTAMTPSFNSNFGVYMYQGACGGNVFNYSLVALVGVQAFTGPIYQSGQYCVQVADYYNQMTAVENYTLTVNHP